jgi:oligosaccharide repeat unit polymerase
MLIASYTILYVISGIAHLQRSDDGRQGFFDMTTALGPGEIINVAFVASGGLAALILGALVRLPNSAVLRRTPPLTSFDRKMVPLLVALLLPISLWAWLKLKTHVAGLEVFGGRVIQLSGGNARYAYMAHWSVYLIGLSVIWYALSKPRPVTARFAIVAGAIGIALSLGWSGGRADAFLSVLPIVLVLLPRARLRRPTALISGAVLAIVVYWRISSQSARRLSETNLQSGLVDWVDWEVGRFSILGWAMQYTDENGLVYGETLVNGGARLIAGFLKIFGLPAPALEQRSAQRIATEVFNRGSAGHLDYVNPSVVAEMYLNFGVLGVLGSCFLLGIASGYVDKRFISSETAIIQLLWAVVGTYITIYALITEATAPLSFLLNNSLPMVLAALASAAACRSDRTHPADRLDELKGAARQREQSAMKPL